MVAALAAALDQNALFFPRAHARHVGPSSPGWRPTWDGLVSTAKFTDEDQKPMVASRQRDGADGDTVTGLCGVDTLYL